MSVVMKKNTFDDAMHYFNSNQYAISLMHAKTHLKEKPYHKDTLKLIAYIHFKEKNYTLALKPLSDIIATNQADAEIYNLIGAVFLEAGDYKQSILYLEKSIDDDKNFLNAYTNLAFALNKSQHFKEASIFCENAIKVFPNAETLLAQYADATFFSMDYAKSTQVHEQWLSITPDSIKANIGLAKCNLSLKRTHQVLVQLEGLKKLTNDLSPVILDISNELLKCGETKLAISSYLGLLKKFTKKEILYNNIASAYDEQGDPKKAVAYFLKAIKENKQYISAHSNLGRVYTDLQNFKKAEHHLLYALSIQTNNINALINIARLYEHTAKFSKTKEHLLHALSIAPKNPIIHCNLANAYHHLGAPVTANKHYKACLSIDPNHGDAEQNLGINELAMGKFDSAWQHYFKRLRILNRGEQLSTIIPGMSLEGKRVCFFSSQGLGDELFFLRFLPLLKSQHVEITYRSSKKTYALFSQIRYIDHLINEDEQIPECDYTFSIDDLPLILNMNSIGQIPPSLKLTPDNNRVNKIKKTLHQFPAPYTGITWKAGNQAVITYQKDSRRVLSKEFPLKLLPAVLSAVQGSIVILQRHPEKSDIEYLSNTLKQPIVDLSSHNESLEEMLATLSLIDDCIGVSNTNTHLFTALDKSSKVLVPFPPDWRWMNEGSVSPWFPDCNIYRQTAKGDWEKATDELAVAIMDKIT